MKRLCEFFLALFAAGFIFSSCATAPGITGGNIIAQETPDDEEILPEAEKKNEEETESRHILKFTGRGIKCELESMELENCMVVDDPTASAGKAVRWGKGSRASLEMELPEGTFEILFSQKAWYTNGSHFSAAIGEKKYELYPSEPPLGKWELTLRKPAVYKNDAQTTVTVTVESGEGFLLDYFQIVRISE
ncbi:MAG: hypothetical protein II114_04870 [Treponema sp.]|nr:hypothetical protein [Treponema sp.]